MSIDNLTPEDLNPHREPVPIQINPSVASQINKSITKAVLDGDNIRFALEGYKYAFSIVPGPGLVKVHLTNDVLPGLSAGDYYLPKDIVNKIIKKHNESRKLSEGGIFFDQETVDEV